MVRLLHPGRPETCARAPDHEHNSRPSPEELAEARKGWRDAIHSNRNNMTVSVQIARLLERSSKTMLAAADEMVAEMQKSRERLH